MPEPAGLRPQHVAPRPLAGAADLLGTSVPPAGAEVAIAGITHDSRTVRPGDLYVALPGANAHGADFAVPAAAAGARAALTDFSGRARLEAAGLPTLVVPDPRARLGRLASWVYGDPAGDLLLMGVTGTNGKTTVAHLVDAVLRHAGRSGGLVGTIETRVDQQRIASSRTTPEATDLHALLAVMRERGVTACVMEVSSHALVMGRVDGIVFDVAAFTNLSQDHLDFHGDMESYYRAKAALFTPGRSRRAVVCVDDAYGRRLAAEADVPVTTVAGDPEARADWRVLERETVAGGRGTAFTLLHVDGRRLRPNVPMPGAFNVVNAAVAAVTCLQAGVAPGDVEGGLATAPGIPGRMQRVEGPAMADHDAPLLVVDYAHSPEAVDIALAALRPSAGRLVAVIGAGGDRDRAKRPLMGEVAARLANVVIVTDDNPRSEDPAAIRAAVLDGTTRVPARDRAEVIEVADRRAAVHRALALAGRGDTVLVAGKGHEQGQEVAGEMHPFDDVAVLREALETRERRRRGRGRLPLTLADVAAATGGELVDVPSPEAAVTAPVVVDSRQVEPGGLFVAVPGERVDGHDYAAGAIEAGALAVLATRPLGVPTVLVRDSVTALGRLARETLARVPDVAVVAVTGSSGKTSTKDLLAQVLARVGPTVAPPGSYNNEIGLPLTVLRCAATTRVLVLEMGARGRGHIAELCRTAPPRMGVVLNVGSAHVGEFGSREAVAAAKRELVEALPADGLAVLNADDDLVAAMAGHSAAPVLTFAALAKADVRAEDVRLDAAARPSFALVTPAGRAEVTLRLHGAHHVPNALATAAVAHALGLAPAETAAALGEAVPLSRWRMEVRESPGGVVVVNDAYNANPESVRAALEALVAMAAGRRTWAILGEMRELGAAAQAAHEAIGRLVMSLGISRLVAVGEAARAVHEAASQAATSAASQERSDGGWPQFAPDVPAALALLREQLRSGDVVLVKASRTVGLEALAEALLAPPGPVLPAAPA